MAYSERTSFFSRRVRRSREELRMLLRVVPGGKAPAAEWLDRRNLEEDRFLREHRLEHRSPSSIIAERPSPFDDAG